SKGERAGRQRRQEYWSDLVVLGLSERWDEDILVGLVVPKCSLRVMVDDFRSEDRLLPVSISSGVIDPKKLGRFGLVDHVGHAIRSRNLLVRQYVNLLVVLADHG